MGLPGLPQPPLDETTGGTHQIRMHQIVERFRTVLAEEIQRFEDPRDALTVAMSAGIVFAGIQAGTLIGMGDFQESPAQLKQIEHMIETNFASGIQMGKLKTAQVIAKTGKAN